MQKEMSSAEQKHMEMEERQKKIENNMAKIKHKIVVISGKGGVGKTTVAVNLAISLASVGLRVGIIDVDITGPNVLKMLVMSPELKPRVNRETKNFYPVKGPFDIKAVSMGFLLQDTDTPVIWRGPMKMGAVRQFLGEAEWGELDYLVCDLPPGTSDETLDILQLIPDENVVIVSTPQEVALMDARRTIRMAQVMKRNVLGIVENMSGFKCPNCGKHIDLYPPGGGLKAAEDYEIELLGKIPFEIGVSEQGDRGLPFVLKDSKSASSQAFKAITEKIRNLVENSA